ncbi:MAG: D-2-hydroxyacid dehydrogenase [Actinomycetota bacterium]
MSEAGEGSHRTILVAGVTEDDPAPGLETVAERVRLVPAAEADDVASLIAEADAVFAWRAEAALLEGAWPNARRVRWIQSASTGVDALLFPALVESDVEVTNTRGVFDEGMAEYTLGLLLAFAKDLIGTIDHQREGIWAYRHSELLAGTRLLVVGAGSIGSAVGRLGRACGMRVEGIARTPREADPVFERIGGRDELLERLGEADWVVDVLPGASNTDRLFDARAFAAMRRSARFINIGRGTTVDENALVEALDAGRIAGAALDVFADEPLPDGSPLWAMRNVIVSPHMSGDVVGWERAVVGVFLDNLDRWLSDEPLHNVVDKRLGYAPRAALPRPDDAGSVGRR